MSRWCVVMALGLLSGCATYRAEPLPSVEAVLGTPFPVRGEVVSPEHVRLPARAVDPTSPLADLDVGRLALVTSPDLAASRARVGVADAQLIAAGPLPDPQLGLSFDRPTAPGLVDAAGAGISFDLGALVTRGPRVAGARASRGQAKLDVAWAEWLALNQARVVVRRLQSLEGQIAVSLDAERASQALHDLMSANMLRGDARLDDVAIFQLGLLDAKDRRLSLERQRSASRQQLNAILGAPMHAALRLAPRAALRPVSELDANTLARRAADRRLDLGALREGYASQEHALRAATRLALPLPQLSLNRARDTGGVTTNGLAIGMPLPLWNRNRGDIAVATATRAQLAAEYRARLVQARSDISSQIAELRAIDEQRRILARDLPSLEASAAVLAGATREGSVTAVTYETVRSAVLGRQLALLALEQAQAEAEVALETAVGDFVWPP